MAKQSHRDRRELEATSVPSVPDARSSPRSTVGNTDDGGLESLTQGVGLDGPTSSLTLSGPTGRVIATLPRTSGMSIASVLSTASGQSGLRHVCHSGDFGDTIDMTQASEADALVFDEFGIAILNPRDDGIERVGGSLADVGFVLEPEMWNHALGMLDDTPAVGPMFSGGPSGGDSMVDYFQGYRDALSLIVERLRSSGQVDRRGMDVVSSDFADNGAATWGIQATGVVNSTLDGAGVKLAVLDSGFDVSHRDFVGRPPVSESFIPDSVQSNGVIVSLTDRSAVIDRSGHGTHCIGTAAGPLTPSGRSRYGVASRASVFNGKVLSVIPGTNRASGADGWILAGIRWAIRQGCSIISMSLGSATRLGESYPTAYEELAKAALENGVLIVAAAGNESDRRVGVINPVGRPANCPSILAVAAVDRFMNVAYFSNRHLNASGGEVNLSGPGVGIWSSFPMPRAWASMNGTSQATPHVAGIAALVQQETGKVGLELYKELKQRAKPLGSRADFGNGLVRVS